MINSQKLINSVKYTYMRYDIKKYSESKTRDLIDCECDQCNKTFQSPKRNIYISIKRKQQFLFCGRNCFNKHSTKIEYKERNCKFCNKKITKNPNIFCNSSCSAKFNNRLKPKKIKKISIKKEKYIISIGFLTKDFLFKNRKNWQSARTDIRRHAQFIFSSHKKTKQCERCGYDKHIEVCHIKPVSEFSKESTLNEINNIENLLGLCPNCHWEFDNLPK